jgi:hypothetical protein
MIFIKNNIFLNTRFAMREITLFLHSQKIQRPRPVISTAISNLASGLRSALCLLGGLRRAQCNK